jgi:hypothetical protein
MLLFIYVFVCNLFNDAVSHSDLEPEPGNRKICLEGLSESPEMSVSIIGVLVRPMCVLRAWLRACMRVCVFVWVGDRARGRVHAHKRFLPCLYSVQCVCAML